MKKLFTFVLALVATFAANAQTWQAGDDVTAQLGLGDCDGTFSGDWAANDYDGGDVKSAGNYWKGDIPNEFRAVEDGHGVLAFYNRSNFDMYQVVLVPAGSYTIKVQSYYREGNPDDTFTNWNNKGRVKKNAYLYASLLESEDATSTVVRDFSKLIRSMADSDPIVTAERYSSSLGWASDGHKKKKFGTEDPENGIEVYFPSCNMGNYYYLAGANACYPNEMKIVLSEPAYVRMGIRKIATIPEDYVPFYDFQVIYNGPADTEAVLEAAREDCNKALEELEDFKTQLEDAGFEGFAGAVGDILLEFEDQIDDAETTDALDAILANINSTVETYLQSLVSVNSLDDLISMSADMLASTNFPGLAAFQAAYDQAVADAKTDDAEKLGDDPGAYFAQVYQTLAEARANYLDSQDEDEDGAKDFSGLIKYPWFVNPEYTPTQNENGGWVLTNAPEWAGVNATDYVNEVGNDGRADISSLVILGTDATVNNSWYKRLKTFGNGWSANSFHLYVHSGLVGVSQGWCSAFEDWEGVCQQLVGLPNGYYSLKGLARANGADGYSNDNLPPYHNIFAQNSAGEVVRSVITKTDDYYNNGSWGWYNNNPLMWQEHKTGTIQVADGKLLIGCQSSWIADFTGFRLMFYGTNPPFTKLIQKELDAIETAAAALTFPGDLSAIAALKEKIVLPIPDADAYEAALVVVHDINEYISFATQAQKNNNALETINKLMDQYTTDEEQAILAPAFQYALALGDGENDVYTMIEPANETANKYGDYLSLYAKAIEYKDAIGSRLTEQVEALKAEYKDTETLQNYIDALMPVYNRALFAAKGAAEATESNPLDMTSIIVNPDFYDSPSNGWTGETPTVNEYGQEFVPAVNDVKGLNAELWNKSAFTLSQKLVGLPAGTYELRVQALYRDGGAVTEALVKQYNDEFGTEKGWSHDYAQLFAKTSDANDQSVNIKAIEALKATKPSFVEGHFKLDKGASETDENDNIIEPAYEQNLDLYNDVDDNGNKKYYDADGNLQPSYPFDTRVDIKAPKANEEDEDVIVATYYYPASMYGFYCVCQADPEFFRHSVQITIEDGETLEIGIRKTNSIGSDWVIFDNFQLFYLSGDTFKDVTTVIKDAAAPKAQNNAFFNLAGQRVNKNYKGIVINSNGVKSYNK